MTILKTILDGLEKITVADIAQSALSLEPPAEGERVHGQVNSEHARRCWALAHHYEREAEMYAYSARFGAQNAEERDRFNRLHTLAHTLEEIARDLAWAEMRQELDFWIDGDRIGLREEFTLVETKGAQAMFETHILPLGRMPIELLRALREMARRQTEPPTEGTPN